jgi:hypothetical protein
MKHCNLSRYGDITEKMYIESPLKTLDKTHR